MYGRRIAGDCKTGNPPPCPSVVQEKSSERQRGEGYRRRMEVNGREREERVVNSGIRDRWMYGKEKGSSKAVGEKRDVK